jgi:hypothetical protein
MLAFDTHFAVPPQRDQHLRNTHGHGLPSNARDNARERSSQSIRGDQRMFLAIPANDNILNIQYEPTSVKDIASRHATAPLKISSDTSDHRTDVSKRCRTAPLHLRANQLRLLILCQLLSASHICPTRSVFIRLWKSSKTPDLSWQSSNPPAIRTVIVGLSSIII